MKQIQLSQPNCLGSIFTVLRNFSSFLLDAGALNISVCDLFLDGNTYLKDFNFPAKKLFESVFVKVFSLLTLV